MARFFRYFNAKMAQNDLWSVNKSIANFRDMCRKSADDEETFYNFVTLMVASIGAQTDEQKQVANAKLLDFVKSFEPYAKRLAKLFARQGQAIAYLKGKGIAPDLGLGDGTPCPMEEAE